MSSVLEREAHIDKPSEIPRYDLSLQELHNATQTLLGEKIPDTDEKLICYSFEPSSRDDEHFKNIARTVERIKFEKAFGNDAERMHELYGKYEHRSNFFLTVDQENGRPVAAVRAIEAGEGGFMTLNDVANEKRKQRMRETGEDIDIAKYAKGFEAAIFQHYDIKSAKECWDIGTAAVLDEYPGQSPLVYRGMYVASRRKGIRSFFSIVDQRAFKMMENLGFPFKPLIGTTWGPYEGSESSLPVYGDAPSFEAAVREREQALPERVLARSTIQRAFRILGHGSSDDQLHL